MEPSVNNGEERTHRNKEGQAQHNSAHSAGESSQEIKQESENPENKGKGTEGRLSSSVAGKVKAEKDKRLTDNSRDKTEKDKQDKPLGSADKEPENGKTPGNRSKQGNPDQLLPVQGGYLVEIPISEISPNEKQPRTVFDDGELRELADSIKEVGVLQPVVVRRRGPEHDDSRDSDRDKRTGQQPDGNARKQDQERSRKYMRQEQDHSSPAPQYELIMGERRLRASILTGLKTIPAIVKTVTDDNMLRDALLENLHRVALNPLEEAAAYQQMMEDFGLTQEQLSKSVSKSRPQIANTLRLLQLPASVQKKVASGVLSAGHARALLSLSSSESMEKLANRIVAEGLSVRSTEELVVMQSHRASQKKHKPSQNVWASAPEIEQLSNYFDTKVDIKGTSRKGRIEITFTSQEDLHRIISVIQQGSRQQGSSQGQNPSQGTADGWF
ncbi:MAG: ParB/RepB/Spo0J family partition protein [Scardovia wiggsiae]